MDVFNTREYEYADITVILGGRDVTGLRGVKYTAKQEKELLHAKGNRPHSVQRGNKSYEGSISLTQSELEALSMASGGSVLDANVDIVVAYGNPAKGDVVHTDLIKGAEFTEAPKGMAQGDKFAEIELPFVAINVIDNYI